MIHFEFDTLLYYVDSLSHQHAPSYFRLDTRLGWHPIHALEVSLVAQNLPSARHLEFGQGQTGVEPTQVERSICGKITWRF